MKLDVSPILLAVNMENEVEKWAPSVAIVLVGVLAVTWLGSLAIGRLITPFSSRLQTELQKAERSSLERGFPNGGSIIGQLERFLIYLFVLSGEPTGVGFLVAAKSVFRFGELSEHHNRLEAEYITIGTLLSFGWGLLVSILARLALQAVLP